MANRPPYHFVKRLYHLEFYHRNHRKSQIGMRSTPLVYQTPSYHTLFHTHRERFLRILQDLLCQREFL